MAFETLRLMGDRGMARAGDGERWGQRRRRVCAIAVDPGLGEGTHRVPVGRVRGSKRRGCVDPRSSGGWGLVGRSHGFSHKVEVSLARI